jgi:uncharacterized protein YjlB
MSISVTLLLCHDTGEFPGSPLPVVLYKQLLRLPRIFKPAYVKMLFGSNGWSNSWDSGVFTYHHYHSTTHEVLGFYEGSTRLQLGGENGQKIEVGKGDVLIIPAGVAHKNLGREFQVKCIGAYPGGREYDIKTGKSGERPGTDRTIAALPRPESDPLFGKEIGIVGLWSKIKKTSAVRAPVWLPL